MDFAIGFFLGVLFSYAVLKILSWLTWREIERRGLERILADLRQPTGEESFQANVVSLRVEQHQDIFLFFEVDTDQFVAQGRDYQEVRNILAQKFRDRTVAITAGTEEDIQRFRATQAV
jgi:hypothetical protein